MQVVVVGIYVLVLVVLGILGLHERGELVQTFATSLALAAAASLRCLHRRHDLRHCFSMVW